MSLREQKRQARGPQGGVRLAASDGDISGKLVAVAEKVSKTYPGASGPVVRDLTTRVLRGDRLGIVGPNGSGKTTLLKLLTGELAPDSGRIALGAALRMEVLDQRRASLDETLTLARTLTGDATDLVTVRGERRHVVGYMKDFLFAPEQARTPVGVLSGGERGRLTLAVALARPSNLLVLDEPTNDLDLETLDLLQEMLAEYAGTVLLVSHDRDFLDRVATSVIVAEGEGRWVEYAGGYSDMLAQRGAAAPARAAVASGAAPVRPVERAVPAARARGLSFKDRHALQQLPGRMERLRADMARHSAILANPDLYAARPDQFRVASDALAKSQSELAAAEEQWLELEMMREDAEK